jgi:hypothetical protein
MMCHPIKDSLGDVIGVAQVINKANDASFMHNDECVFEKYLQFCGIGLRNAQLYERSQLEVRMFGGLFSTLGHVDKAHSLPRARLFPSTRSK